MSLKAEFGTIDEADEVRSNYGEQLHDSDDLRSKTVRFDESLPAGDRRDLERRADASRADTQSGPGQIPLTDAEKKQIDFSRKRANVLKYRAIKGVAEQHGVDDWLSYADATLEVSEHHEVMERAKRDEQGQRMDAEETDEQRARRLETQAAGKCDHAEDHCENGDPEACEYLREECGVDVEIVDRLMAADEFDDELPDGSTDELTGPQAGALSRSWGGYRGAVAALEEDLADVRESLEHAEQAVRAIHAIEGEAGLEATTTFERLEDHHQTLAELATAHPGASHGQPQGSQDVQEETEESCGCDHDPGGDHPHGVSEDDLEAATEAVHDAGRGPEKKAEFMAALEEWAEEYPSDAVAEGADNLAFLTLGRPNDTVNVRKAVDQALAEADTDPEDVFEESDEMCQLGGYGGPPREYGDGDDGDNDT